MFEATTGTAIINGYSGCTVSTGTTLNTNLNGTVGMGNINPSTRLEITPGLQLSGNSTINYSNNLGQSMAVTPKKDMTPKQVNVAVFTITRDVDTNEINSTKFVKELWVEQKNGASIDLLVAKQLGSDFDPETTIIKVLLTVSF
jgi:hypothetical protein